MIKLKIETQDLLLSITKNCETLINQIHIRLEETLEFIMLKQRGTFHSNPPIQIESDWMLGLIDLGVYNSIFDITEENNKLELYKYPDSKVGGVSYEKVRDEIEKDLGISDITATDLQDDIIGPIIIKEYREQVTKRMEDCGYMNILSSYRRSVFQNFESYLGTEIDLVEDDIGLVLDKYFSNFFTYELQPGIYTFKDLGEALFNILHPKRPQSSDRVVVELDDITRKTKFVVGSGIIAIRFDEKSFSSTILGCTSGWDYKHYNGYARQKIVNLSITNKIHLKSVVIDGSVVNGLETTDIIYFCFR